jgi:hypothetical protein
MAWPTARLPDSVTLTMFGAGAAPLLELATAELLALVELALVELAPLELVLLELVPPPLLELPLLLVEGCPPAPPVPPLLAALDVEVAALEAVLVAPPAPRLWFPWAQVRPEAHSQKTPAEEVSTERTRREVRRRGIRDPGREEAPKARPRWAAAAGAR